MGNNFKTLFLDGCCQHLSLAYIYILFNTVSISDSHQRSSLSASLPLLSSCVPPAPPHHPSNHRTPADFPSFNTTCLPLPSSISAAAWHSLSTSSPGVSFPRQPCRYFTSPLPRIPWQFSNQAVKSWRRISTCVGNIFSFFLHVTVRKSTRLQTAYRQTYPRITEKIRYQGWFWGHLCRLMEKKNPECMLLSGLWVRDVFVSVCSVLSWHSRSKMPSSGHLVVHYSAHEAGSFKLACSHSSAECSKAMDLLLGRSGIDPPLVQQREVLSGKSIGEVINHYCMVNSDPPRFCSLFCLSAGKGKQTTASCWPKADKKKKKKFIMCVPTQRDGGDRGGRWMQRWRDMKTNIYIYIYRSFTLAAVRFRP